MSAPAPVASSSDGALVTPPAPVLSKRQQKKRKHREQAPAAGERDHASKRAHQEPAKKHTTGRVDQPIVTIVADGLRYIQPYPFEMSFFVKKRWYGSLLLDMLRVEYKNPLVDYYDRLIAAGCVQVQPARATSTRITEPAVLLARVVQPNDLVVLTMHRHEPPVAATAIDILHNGATVDVAASPAGSSPAASMELAGDSSSAAETIVVNKPGGIPVHASGRYFANTIVGILKAEHGIDAIPVHRLDRITSGLLLLSLTRANGIALSRELSERRVQKEYLARVVGRFPDGKTIVEKAIRLKGERASRREDNSAEEPGAQNGSEEQKQQQQKDAPPSKPKAIQPSNPFMSSHVPARIAAVAAPSSAASASASATDAAPTAAIPEVNASTSTDPDRKTASTEFEFLSFDGSTSLVRCRPLTGRTHQIRLHLSSLGHPIANDFVYGGRWYESNTYTDRAAQVYAAAGVEWQAGCAECDQNRMEVEADQATKAPAAGGLPSNILASGASTAAVSSGAPAALYCSSIWLHCSRYAGPSWCYEAPIPHWAAPDFNSQAAMAHPVHVHASQVVAEEATEE